MLFLRRCVGERIAIFDTRSEFWIEIIDLEPVGQSPEHVVFQLSDETRAPLGKPITLHRNKIYRFLNGEGSIKFTGIFEFEEYPDAAGLGIDVPAEFSIERAERLAGLTRDQRVQMAAMR